MSARLFFGLALLALASAQTVLVLTDANFEQQLIDTPKILVEFYAPWCGHCKSLAPKYDAAAEKLGAKGTLAKVDCTENADLCSKYGVKGYPTLKFFSNGVAADYQKGRTTDDIVNFVLEQGKAAVTDLNTAEEAKAFVAESSAAVTVLAFGAASEAFSATADALRMDGFSFAHSDDAAVAEAFGVTVAAGATMVVAFKKFDAPQVPFAGAEFTTEALTAFLTAESFPSFGEIGPDTYRKYVDRKLPLVYYFVDPSSEAEKAVTEAGKAVAPTYKGQLSFVAIDGVQYAKHGESLGATQTPMIVVHDMEKNKKFVTSKVTEAEQREFFEQWAAGTLQPFKKSAAVPAPQAVKGVQVLVGLNFEEVAFDKTKDVLVEFYAPWCGHCKSLAPKYEKLGAMYTDDANVIIANLDATANDTPAQIDGFPTIIFYPAGEDKTGIPYEGEREEKAMHQWVQEHRTSVAAAAAKAHDEL